MYYPELGTLNVLAICLCDGKAEHMHMIIYYSMSYTSTCEDSHIVKLQIWVNHGNIPNHRKFSQNQ